MGREIYERVLYRKSFSYGWERGIDRETYFRLSLESKGIVKLKNVIWEDLKF